MSKCKYCGSEIEWREVRGTKYPLDPTEIEYDELKMGERLLTPGGNVISYVEGKSYPNVHGQVIHFDTCMRN